MDCINLSCAVFILAIISLNVVSAQLPGVGTPSSNNETDILPTETTAGDDANTKDATLLPSTTDLVTSQSPTTTPEMTIVTTTSAPATTTTAHHATTIFTTISDPTTTSISDLATAPQATEQPETTSSTTTASPPEAASNKTSSTDPTVIIEEEGEDLFCWATHNANVVTVLVVLSIAGLVTLGVWMRRKGKCMGGYEDVESSGLSSSSRGHVYQPNHDKAGDQNDAYDPL